MLNLSVAQLCEENTIADNFLPKGEFKVILDYPLGEDYVFTVKGPLSTYNLSVLIAQKYKEIYANPDKYSVWGHKMDDLYIEGLTVNLQKSTVEVDMGS